MMESLQQQWLNFWSDRYRAGLFFLLIFLAFFSVYALNPTIEGDSLLYVNSIEVLKGNPPVPDFIPMMILSTYLGLKLIMLLNLLTSNIAVSWVLLNGSMFLMMGLFFYALLKRMFNDRQVAFIGTLFLATNYGAVSFGMAYMMDIGGWAFYIASLYFIYRYLESDMGGEKWLYLSAAMIGVGGLYKEYAFVACVVVAGVIMFKYWGQWWQIVMKGIFTALLALGPFLVMNIYTFVNFDHYTYLDWFAHNQNSYIYQNRVVEFIKSFGSIYNFAWLLFVGGFYLLLKRSKDIFEDKNILFIWLTVLSCSAIILWPVVTRVLFITMPAVILVSGLLIQKINRKILIIGPILACYIVANYLMDAYILELVNLPF